MRKLVALALALFALLAACGDESDGGADGVPAWAQAAEIARTPDGATLLWRVELDESGEDGTITWAAFSADGDRIAGDVAPYAPWRVRAYDGGFLVVSGAEVPYAPMMLLDEATGEASEPDVIDVRRPVQPGDLAVADHGNWSFRPSDGTVARFPEPPRAAFGPDAGAGAMLPTVIDGSGVITVVEARIANPRTLYRSTDGGETWQSDSVRLPDWVADVDGNEMFTGDTTTAMTLLGEDSVPVGVLVHTDGSWRLSEEFDAGLADYTVAGLAGGRVLLVPNDGVDGPGYLGDAAVPTRLEAVDADELRPLSDGLASMSPTPRISYDGGQTWEPLALGS